MPSKVWAVGEEVLAADMNDYIQEQVVSTFATAAARDAAIPAPNVGQTCYLQDALALYVYTGAAWVTLPKGRLGGTLGGSRDNGPGGNVVHASVSFTLPTSRLCKVEAIAFWQAITASMTGSCSMGVGFDGSTTMRLASALNMAVNGSVWGMGYDVAVLAAGAHTADLKAINAATGGTQRLTAGTSRIDVIDLGGV